MKARTRTRTIEAEVFVGTSHVGWVSLNRYHPSRLPWLPVRTNRIALPRCATKREAVVALVEAANADL